MKVILKDYVYKRTASRVTWLRSLTALRAIT